jgi:lipase chaperone LimK
MIEIQGLSARQQKLAQLLWLTQDVEQFRAVMQQLQGRDRLDAQGIAEIMIQEFLWETLDDDYESKELCASVISRASSSS